jgi:hypothetical protein
VKTIEQNLEIKLKKEDKLTEIKLEKSVSVNA